MKEWVKLPHISINEKNLENLCLKEKLIKSNHTKWLLFIISKKNFDVTIGEVVVNNCSD